MKILHTADWHLGHRLHNNSQLEEQLLFLEWITNYIKNNEIDVLLISGDIFDTGIPSSQSMSVYYNFLVGINNTSCKHIVITGGNHDSPGNLNAPKELLNALSITVVGKATENIEDEIITIKHKSEELIIAAIPYLRDQDIRKAVAGETFDLITERYKTALVNHYTQASNYCKTIKTNQSFCLAMGHLFAIGGSVSDSEHNIYVGNLGHIGAMDFPKLFNYIALGHLHRPQIVGGKNHIRYSGSPIILSFSELNYDKNIIVLNTKNAQLQNIENIQIPRFREVFKVQGEFDECVEKLKTIQSNKYNLTPWVEVELDNEKDISIGANDVYKATESLNIEILKVGLKSFKKIINNNEKIVDIKSMSANEVFELKCKELNFDLSKHPDVLDAFNEILQITKQQ